MTASLYMRTVPASGRLLLDPGPSFMTDPGRGCNAGNAHLFFSDDIVSHEQRVVERAKQELAKKICRPCPVRLACARWALEHGERDGVWGGYVMSCDEDRRKAIAETGWKPAPKPPTVEELRTQREAERLARAALVEDTIREMWEQGQPDGAIALRTGSHPGAIARIRKRLGLPALFGPGGKRLERELVNA